MHGHWLIALLDNSLFLLFSELRADNFLHNSKDWVNWISVVLLSVLEDDRSVIRWSCFFCCYVTWTAFSLHRLLIHHVSHSLSACCLFVTWLVCFLGFIIQNAFDESVMLRCSSLTPVSQLFFFSTWHFALVLFCVSYLGNTDTFHFHLNVYCFEMKLHMGIVNVKSDTIWCSLIPMKARVGIVNVKSDHTRCFLFK